MLDMTKPVHYTRKIVSMDSGFCCSVGIIAMHYNGVYGQSIIKKQRYWTKNVPGGAIDSYFANNLLGRAKTFRQVINENTFLFHCHKDDRYVTKLMSTHGLILSMKFPSTRRTGDSPGSGRPSIILSPSPAKTTQILGG